MQTGDFYFGLLGRIHPALTFANFNNSHKVEVGPKAFPAHFESWGIPTGAIF
jgi:hypothetical protein